MRAKFWFWLLLSGAMSLSGQSLRITDFAVSWGIQNHYNRAYSGPDLLERVSGSELIPGQIAEYQNESYLYSYGTAAFEVYAGLAWLQPGSPTHKRLRFAFSYSKPLLFSDSYFLEVQTAFDTLRSGNTGEEVYVDSIYHSRLGLNYSVSSLALNTAFLWSTNDASRFSFYGGVNLSIQLNIAASISLDRYDFSTKQIKGDPQIYNPNDEHRQIVSAGDRYAENNSMGLGSSAILGFNWRLGQTGKNLNSLHLFSEIRPGMALNFLPGLEAWSGFTNSLHLGLRFSL